MAAQACTGGSVRVLQPDFAEQQKLLLGEIGIDQRKRDAM